MYVSNNASEQSTYFSRDAGLTWIEIFPVYEGEARGEHDI